MKKYELYRMEHARGLTCREIATKYGVSFQNVAQACTKYNSKYFRYHSEDSIIYPNIREWLNNNKITISELARRMDVEAHASNIERIRNILNGKHYPRKTHIDKLIFVTGMSYEKLFEM